LVPEGPYTCFKLKKKEWATLELLLLLAKTLHIPVKNLGIAGMKDKRGITEQYVSAPNITKEQLAAVTIKNVELTFIGYLAERITLGQLEGNHFIITVRDLPEQKTINTQQKILNLFDYQRFGKEQQNIALGKALLTEDYKTFCKQSNLTVQDNNYVGAIRTCNKRVLRFILCAYQSHLWNNVVQRLTKDYETVPVLGYLIDLEGEIKNVYEAIMQEEGITQEQFKMKKIPELASEGNERKMYLTLTNLKTTWAPDKGHQGKYKCILEFDLGKGQYATHAVKTLLN
ncbi:MAG: tRNA pseudouridine(13) synthase TruD, partial [Nanoarchaeota archaeon]|nr:tRNA pseudouridine(13) synthase TruD [Nanoarchaeota archaeon]